MHIEQKDRSLGALRAQMYTYIGRDGGCEERTEELLVERELKVYINDILCMKLVCLPGYETELVLGRLLTAGIIASADEVEAVSVGEDGSELYAVLRQNAAPCRPYVDTTDTCGSGNRLLNDRFVAYRQLCPVQPIRWRVEDVFALADRFAEGMPLHEKTWATHSCLLARGSELLFTCEDIGRHNALDKAIGYALRNGIDLRTCTVYTSGRIPTDMAVKAIRAGIPVMSGKASTTMQAVELARKYGLTLICAARRDRMKLMVGALPEL